VSDLDGPGRRGEMAQTGGRVSLPLAPDYQVTP
jgi:hypothetical protein